MNIISHTVQITYIVACYNISSFSVDYIVVQICFKFIYLLFIHYYK